MTCRRSGVGLGWPSEEGGGSREHRLVVDHRQNTRHWKCGMLMFESLLFKLTNFSGMTQNLISTSSYEHLDEIKLI